MFDCTLVRDQAASVCQAGSRVIVKTSIIKAPPQLTIYGTKIGILHKNSEHLENIA